MPGARAAPLRLARGGPPGAGGLRGGAPIDRLADREDDPNGAISGRARPGLPAEDPRVLFVDQSGEPGGAELFLLDVAARYRWSSRVVLLQEGPLRAQLAERGVEVQVLPAPASVRGVRREAGGLSEIRSAPALAALSGRLARLARDHDLIYANSQKALVVAAFASARSGVPLVWNLHDLLVPEHFSRLHRAVAIGLANRWARRVVANSHATARAFVAGGGRKERVRVIYPGSDARAFAAAPVTPAGALARRRAMGLEGVPVVGLFGRLARWKGQEVLLGALARLPGVHALLVGGPLFGEEAFAAALIDQARRLEVAGRVHFLGHRNDVPELMAACDAVVHASTAPEPFGRVIVEAMLAGRPVVATAAGGATEVVEDGRSGLLVPPGDAAALAASLRRLLDDATLARALGEAGRRRALEHFTLDASLRGLDRELRALLHRYEP